MDLPAVVLVVSGGHTETLLMEAPGRYRALGRTRDDAAGETFDKAAKLMDLGYPGGPRIEALAREGRPGRVQLPRGLRGRGELDFSFSGLKTAVRLHLEGLGPRPGAQERADLARALQESVVESLAAKTAEALAAVRREGGAVRGLYLAGGVAANGPLRAAFADLAAGEGLAFRPPPLAYCTDNAAMIGWAGRTRLLAGRRDGLDLAAFARGPVRSWAED
jgi:N6-L-threonylcarbamoyladenine synthase